MNRSDRLERVHRRIERGLRAALGDVPAKSLVHQIADDATKKLIDVNSDYRWALTNQIIHEAICTALAKQEGGDATCREKNTRSRASDAATSVQPTRAADENWTLQLAVEEIDLLRAALAKHVEAIEAKDKALKLCEKNIDNHMARGQLLNEIIRPALAFQPAAQEEEKE